MKRFRIYYRVGVFPSSDPNEPKGGFCKGCIDVEAETEKEAILKADERASVLHVNRVKGKKLQDMIKNLKSNKDEFFRIMGAETMGIPDSCC